jgi:hypothetical protein
VVVIGLLILHQDDSELVLPFHRSVVLEYTTGNTIGNIRATLHFGT